MEKKNTLVSWVMSITAIEYFIFGIIDPFYGLFVYEVVGDYGTVGLIFGIRTLISLLAVVFLERFFQIGSPVQNLLIANIFMVIFSIAMFASGYWHSVLLLVIMTIGYGFIFSLKTFSRQNMLRQEIPPELFTSTLSQSVSLKYSAWILGMIVGGGVILLWDGIPLYFLFLSIAGLWMFSLFPFFTKLDSLQKMLSRELHPVRSFAFPHVSFSQIKSYFYSFPLIIRYNFSLFGFSEFLGRVTLLFIPILGESLNLHLSQIFWLTAFMISPFVFTQVFSGLVKIVNKLIIIIVSIALSLLPLWYLSHTDIPFWIAMCSFIVSLSLAMLQPALLGISQKYTPSVRIKDTTQMEIFFGMIGNFVGAVGVGYIADLWGVEIAFFVTAFVALIFLLVSLGMKITAPSSHHVIAENTEETEEGREKKILEHAHFHFRRHFG